MSNELKAAIRHDNIHHMIALTCAPLLAGIKISNLYLARRNDFIEVAEALDGTAISMFVLSENSERTAVFLYEPVKLQEYLKRRDVISFLKKIGYSCTEIRPVLKRLSERYRSYLSGEEDFPHELGILLGYPLGDVYGFMKNKGKNYIFSGYWKVYTEPEYARRIFKKYDIVTELLIGHAINGKTIKDIAGMFRKRSVLYGLVS